MSGLGQHPHEFIQDSFAPQVAVLCSHDAQLLCKKNNLSFVELIQPFCRLSLEATLRDPNGSSHVIRNLKVLMRDIECGIPQPTLARKMLSDAVSNALPSNFDLSKCEVMTFGLYDLQLQASCAWYEAYRETFLQVLYPSDHEFTKHQLACIFVVSSSHADAIEQFKELTLQQSNQQNQQPNKLPKWFCPNILRYYVLLHDVTQEQDSKAESLYQILKSTYGVQNCHLLHINSRVPNTTEEQGLPDPWNKFIPTNPQEQTPISTELSGSNAALNNVDINSDVNDDSSTNNDHPLSEENHTGTPAMSLINHVTPTSDMTSSMQRGCCLSLSDHDRLRIFVHEFLVRGLLPWAERQLRTINDQMMTRKGMGRSLLSGAKSWFSGKKPLPQNPAVERPNVVYTKDAPEMQLRRLGDLAFMFQLYELAYQAYHQCKRDFSNDHAWLHLAGAMEMASLSVFMHGSSGQRQYPTHYMEQVITTYQNTCKLPNLATRATMFNCEALKSRMQYSEASQYYVRMTSEDADLRTALFLEQAAHCCLRLKWPMPHKYAFNMILAGHRFNKAGQRRHALRAYSQALQTYKGKGWALAEDHINFTIGRQSCSLKQLDNATLAFKHLFSHTDSPQPPHQQSAFLRDYIFIFKQLESSRQESLGDTGWPQLPLPRVDANATQVLCCHPHSAKQGLLSATSCTFTTNSTSETTWRKLEQHLVVWAWGSLPVVHRPSIPCYTRRTPNTPHPMAVIGELLSVCVYLVNPLKIALHLSDVTLLWRFLPVHYDDEDSPAHVVCNEKFVSKNPMMRPEDIIDTLIIPELVLHPKESKKVQLTLRPSRTGELHITGLGFNLAAPAAETQQTPANSQYTQSLHQIQPGANHLNAFQTVNTSSDSTAVQNQPITAQNGVVQSQSSSGQADDTSLVSAPISQQTVLRVRGKLNLECQGPRLNNTPEERAGKIYGPDRRLDLVIVPAMPRLEVHFIDFPESMLQGEVRQVGVHFTNCGAAPLTRLALAAPCPSLFSFSRGPPTVGTSVDGPQVAPPPTERVEERPRVRYVEPVPLDSDVLKPGQTSVVPMWLCAPTHFSDGAEAGVAAATHLTREYETQMLFYYEPQQKHPRSKLGHRVLRHTIQLQVRPAVLLRGVANRRSHHGSHDVTNNQSDSTHKSFTGLSRDNANNHATTSLSRDASSASLAEGAAEDSMSSASLLVSLNVQNINNDMAGFRIAHVSAVSDCWSLRRLTHHDNDTAIGKGESALMTFVATRKNPVPHGKARVSRQYFCTSQGGVEEVPSTALFFRAEHAVHAPNFEEVETEPPRAPLVNTATQNTPVSTGDERISLSLVVHWQACSVTGDNKTYKIKGQHHVTFTQIGQLTYSTPQPTRVLERPPVRLQGRAPDSVVAPRAGLGAGLGADTQPIQFVQCSLIFPPRITHSFSQHRLCRVTVEARCQNLTCGPVNVQLKTGFNVRIASAISAPQTRTESTDNTPTPPQAIDAPAPSLPVTPPLPSTAPPLASPSPLGPFLWTSGQVSQLRLEASECSCITLTACFSRPGVYNLSTVQLLAAPDTQHIGATKALTSGRGGEGGESVVVPVPMTVQKTPAPCLIVIEDSTKTDT